MMMGFSESTVKLFAYNQEENTSDDDYITMFNAIVESIKAHGRQPWHDPGLADLHMKRIGKEMVRREPDPENIVSSHKDKITKLAILE